MERMKKSRIILICMTLFAVCFAVGANSSKAEAQSFDLDQGATFTFNANGAWKRINSGVYNGSNSTGMSYADYSGEVQYAHVTADTNSIQAAYVVKDRIFDFVGTYSPAESYFNGDTKIWSFNIEKVNGLAPVYKTTMAINEGLYGGTVLFVRANRSIVPNWTVLPNVENMSKVIIEPSYISLNLQ